MTIELVLNFFDWDDPQFRLSNEFRRRIFEEVASSNLRGLIFTYVWALDQEADRRYVDRSCRIFRDKGADIHFVELEAELGERLRRNETRFRLSQKPSKRNVARSKGKLLEHEEQHRFNSSGDFFYQESYLKINNTNLSAPEVAQRIVEYFELPSVSDTD